MVPGLRGWLDSLPGPARGVLVYRTVDLSERIQVGILLVPLDDAKE